MQWFRAILTPLKCMRKFGYETTKKTVEVTVLPLIPEAGCELAPNFYRDASFAGFSFEEIALQLGLSTQTEKRWRPIGPCMASLGVVAINPI